MKSIKLNVYLIILIISSVLMLIFDYFTGLIASYVDMTLSLGASLGLGMIHILLWVAYAIFFIITVVLLFAKMLCGRVWIILTLFLTAALLIFVRSGVYAELYHSAFRGEREALISRVLADDMTGITQTDTNSYYIGDVRISNDADFDLFEHGNGKAFVFEVYRPSLRKNVLVYVQDGTAPVDDLDYYSYSLTDVKNLGGGWYRAKINR